MSQAEGKPLQIYTLGRFRVQKSDRVITDRMRRSNKRWRLFQILITYREQPISLDDLFNWLDLNESLDPQEALKTLVYSLRKDLQEGNTSKQAERYIVSQWGSYVFNNRANYWLDAEVFEELCRKAHSTTFESDSEAVAVYKKALNLYQGNYLAESKPTSWIMSARNHYRELYLRTVLETIKFLRKSGQEDEIWELCEAGLEIVPLEEELHCTGIQALVNTGRMNRARHQYEEAVLVFEDHGLEVPAVLRELGRLLNNNSQQQKEENPYSLLKNIQDRRIKEGAFECDPQVFSAIYDLEYRRSERITTNAYLAHLSLSETSSKETLMQSKMALREILLQNLRKGDAICNIQRFFFLLLVNTNEKQALRSINRIKSAFQSQCADLNVIVESQIYGSSTERVIFTDLLQKIQ